MELKDEVVEIQEWYNEVMDNHVKAGSPPLLPWCTKMERLLAYITVLENEA